MARVGWVDCHLPAKTGYEFPWVKGKPARADSGDAHAGHPSYAWDVTRSLWVSNWAKMSVWRQLVGAPESFLRRIPGRDGVNAI
jgi:hypothetical protein